jgi:hypothetical protein
MTVEQRLDRIEQLHAELMEMAKQDQIAYLSWKRDMESQVQATWLAIDRMAKENEKGFAELRTQSKETDQRLKHVGEETDRRIQTLVTAIGELIERMG